MFTKNEINYIISREKLQKIKETDNHPYFKAFISSHEGNTISKLVGVGYRHFKWLRPAIEQINNFLSKNDVSFYIGHNNKTNNEGRKSFGKVVGSALKEVNGKLYSVVVGYFKSSEIPIVKKMDVISIEAQPKDMVENNGSFIVNGINLIKGIALGDSSKTPPAFKEAFAVGEIQNSTLSLEDLSAELFYEKSIEVINNFSSSQDNSEVKIMKLTDVQQIIRDNKWSVDVIFNENDIKENKIVKKLLEKESNKIKEDQQETIIALKTKAYKNEFSDKLQQYITENKIDNSLEKFLKLNSSEFVMGDKIDESFKSFVTKQENKYEKMLSIGLKPEKVEDNKGDNDENIKKVPMESSDGKHNEEDDPFI